MFNQNAAVPKYIPKAVQEMAHVENFYSISILEFYYN